MHNLSKKSQPIAFRHFTRARYAIFASLHRQVRIGVLSVATLGSVHITKVEASSIAVVTVPESASVAGASASGSPASTDDPDEHELSEVTVAGTMAPLTQLQAARLLSVITRTDIERAAAQTVNDILKLATGVDVRQRGGFGVQTDISINGGTFDQITILLNGVNISNPHTGHLSADFPVSVSDIERIEVLEGAASRVYGASAFGGAINIVTRSATSATSLFSGEGGVNAGSYGTIGADGRISLLFPYAHKTSTQGRSLSPSLKERGSGGESVKSFSLSGLYQRSDGATTNSDFRRGNLFFQGGWQEASVELHWQAGWSRKHYGANTFYSAAYPNQWEANDRIIASIGLGYQLSIVNFQLSTTWHRTYDHFQLIRNTTTGENYHRTDVYGARIGADFRWIGGRTAFAADLRQEGIYSTNLGRPLDSLAYKPAIPHAYVETVSQPLLPSRQQQVYPRHDERTNLALSLEHNLLLGRFTASLGILANSNSYLGDGLHFYPGIDLAYRIGSGWKTYLSYNKGFRLPTFTDLYYKSPTIEGNRDLKAEESHSLQAGVKVNCQLSARQRSTVNSSARPNGTLDPSRTVNCQLSLRAFYNRGRRMIDWVMYNETDVFHSANFDLDNIGVSVDARFDFQPSSVPSQLSPFLRSITIGYAFIHQHRRDAAYVYKSNYAMEYLRHKFTATLHHNIWRHLTANWQLRVQDREGAYIKYENATSTGQLVRYRPYALLDLKLQWDAPRYLLWVEGTNLTNHTYYDLGNIPQPGLTILAGARLRF